MPSPNIQWFPGHMHKARKEIAKRLTQVDLIIEVLDARIPFSSQNPMLAELRGDKRCIKVLNKSDLADSDITTQWLDHYEQNAHVTPLAVCAKEREASARIVSAAKQLLPRKADSIKGIQTLIVGIPNAGKSTLINILAGKSIAKTGNEPAVTKLQQRIDLHNGIVLFDTPGVLWPNVENRNSGFRLAATGAIKDTALDYEDIALFTIDYLTLAYPKSLAERYRISELSENSVDTLESVGKHRGCLVRGGDVDWQRAAKLLINDLRSGALGKFTLETPKMMKQELAELTIIREQKAGKLAARVARKKNKKR